LSGGEWQAMPDLRWPWDTGAHLAHPGPGRGKLAIWALGMLVAVLTAVVIIGLTSSGDRSQGKPRQDLTVRYSHHSLHAAGRAPEVSSTSRHEKRPGVLEAPSQHLRFRVVRQGSVGK
jgi:hypothetical protein